ncbi:SH3 domain-containing protein [Microbacterium arborescens]
MRRVLISDHEAPERPPLRIDPGDVVSVGAWDTEWPAFVFVTTADGSGWVPGRHIRIEGSVGTVSTGYDTTELSQTKGNVVEVVVDDAESGWSWCRAEDGREGWIPHRVLRDA